MQISHRNISGRHIQAERKDNRELEGTSQDIQNFFGCGHGVEIIDSENDETRTHYTYILEIKLICLID